MPHNLSKKNEKIYRIYKEANEQMFQMAAATNRTYSELKYNLLGRSTLRKSYDVA